MKSEGVRKSTTVKDPTTTRALLRPPPPYRATMQATKNPAEYIRENVRKMSLWNSPTLRPIITHDELGVIMSTLGFMGLQPCPGPGGAWKQYAYCGAKAGLVRPSLPFPRVDGLHMVTYASFLESVNFYVRMDNIGDLFHVRAMPLHRIYDRNERWRRMEDDEYSIFLYRTGTLDEPIPSFSVMDYQNYLLDFDSEIVESILIHKNGTSSTTFLVAPLDDIIVRPSLVSSSDPEKDKENDDSKALFVSA